MNTGLHKRSANHCCHPSSLGHIGSQHCLPAQRTVAETSLDPSVQAFDMEVVRARESADLVRPSDMFQTNAAAHHSVSNCQQCYNPRILRLHSPIMFRRYKSRWDTVNLFHFFRLQFLIKSFPLSTTIPSSCAKPLIMLAGWSCDRISFLIIPIH